MSYRVVLKPSAEKDFERLPRQVQRRVLQALVRLEANPRTSGSIKLAGTATTYRLRVGDWRIIYEIDNESRTVFVTIIAHRREVYRGL